MLALPLPLNQQVRAVKVGATSSGATGGRFIQFRASKNEDAQKVFVGDFFSSFSSNSDLRFDMG